VGKAAPAFPVTRGQQSDVDRVEPFRLTLRCFDGVVIYFLNSDYKFFDDSSEFSGISFYVVFFVFKVHVNFSSVTLFIEI